MEFALLFKMVAATLLLLLGAFIVLFFVRKLNPGFAVPTQLGIIKILEKKTDLTIGTIAVVSVLGERYVLLVAKSGVAIHVLDVKPAGSIENQQNV